MSSTGGGREVEKKKPEPCHFCFRAGRALVKHKHLPPSWYCSSQCLEAHCQLDASVASLAKTRMVGKFMTPTDWLQFNRDIVQIVNSPSGTTDKLLARVARLLEEFTAYHSNSQEENQQRLNYHEIFKDAIKLIPPNFSIDQQKHVLFTMMRILQTHHTFGTPYGYTDKQLTAMLGAWMHLYYLASTTIPREEIPKELEPPREAIEREFEVAPEPPGALVPAPPAAAGGDERAHKRTRSGVEEPFSFPPDLQKEVLSQVKKLDSVKDESSVLSKIFKACNDLVADLTSNAGTVPKSHKAVQELLSKIFSTANPSASLKAAIDGITANYGVLAYPDKNTLEQVTETFAFLPAVLGIFYSKLASDILREFLSSIPQNAHESIRQLTITGPERLVFGPFAPRPNNTKATVEEINLMKKYDWIGAIVSAVRKIRDRDRRFVFDPNHHDLRFATTQMRITNTTRWTAAVKN